MVVDLVSPWLAAVETSPEAEEHFRSRHAGLLELLRRQRTPVLPEFPLPHNTATLHANARRANNAALHQRLDDLEQQAHRHGAHCCHQLILLASDAAGDHSAPMRLGGGCIALLLHGDWDDAALERALVFALAALVRWTDPDSQSPVAGLAADQWGIWHAASALPLRESIVTAGLGVHLLAALRPGYSPATLLGIGETAFARMRQREKTLRRLLAQDLDQRGVGLILRWLTPEAPATARTSGAVVLPPMAGHYLGWKMLAAEVERDGVALAMREAV